MAINGKIKLEKVGFNSRNKSGHSSKFWTGWTHGTNFVAHWGRIGTDGQIRSWSCGSKYSADAKLQEKVNSKLAKGYAIA